MIWRKHYRSMYEGSMVGAGATVFALMGYIIGTQEYDRTRGCFVAHLNPILLSAILGEPVEKIRKAIDYLCSKDPNSKSKAEDGRRLVQCEQGSVEYRVVNGGKYQDRRDYEARREQNREAQARFRSKRKNIVTGGGQREKQFEQAIGDGEEPHPSLTS